MLTWPVALVERRDAPQISRFGNGLLGCAADRALAASVVETTQTVAAVSVSEFDED